MTEDGKKNTTQSTPTHNNGDSTNNYWKRMGWDKPHNKKDCSVQVEETVLKKALDRAHDTRKFEIELYWKRANYFWLLQAAVFTALGFSLNADKGKVPEFLPLTLSCLGFLCAYAGYLSANASKFWQKNWEKHIDLLEDLIEGSLYKTVWVGKDGVKHSLSRLNSTLVGCFSWFWSGLILYFFGTFMFQKGFKFEYSFSVPWSDDFSISATFGALSFIFTFIASLVLRSQWTNFSVEDETEIKSFTVIDRFKRYFNFKPPSVFFQPKRNSKDWLKRNILADND